jgi:hypothetical protein
VTTIEDAIWLPREPGFVLVEAFRPGGGLSAPEGAVCGLLLLVFSWNKTPAALKFDKTWSK